MRNLLRNFDGISFWLGFLTAALFMWLLSRLRPTWKRIQQNLKTQARASRQERSLSDEIRLGNDTLRICQQWHLAAPLFSLDEIIIPPRLLAPPPLPMAYEPLPSEDVTDWAIPFTPDWPEIASFYKAPSLSPLEALQSDANLAIVAEPGGGKTVALAYMAGQVIRRDPNAGKLSNHVPILAHASDLSLPAESQDDLLAPLLGAIAGYTSSLPTSRIPKTIETALEQKRGLVMLDGLDELSPSHLQEVCAYLGSILKKYPGNQAVVTADPHNLDCLPALDFVALPIANWSEEERGAFIIRWSEIWSRFIVSASKETIDPMLLVGWLVNNTAQYTPLELTLKIWAAFAGDSLGPQPIDALEAFLRRMTYGQPERNRLAFEQMASQMILAMLPVAERRLAESWLSGSDVSVQELETLPENGDSEDKSIRREIVRARGALPNLLESGLVVNRAADRVSIMHPVLASYLASNALLPLGGGDQLVTQPDWPGKLNTLHYMAATDRQSNWVQKLIQDESIDPLLKGLLSVSRWLRDAPEKSAWCSLIMRQLAGELIKENYTLGLKARLLSAMVLSGNQGVLVLMRQLLNSPQTLLRQLAVLACGMLHDTKGVPELKRLLDDPSPGVSRAVLLALIAIGEKSGMETVAFALLQGDESLRRAAAESLANHPEEGHPTLEEGGNLDDPAVRRAVAFGLGRIQQPWATSMLEKMRSEDTQWVVQDAATQVLEKIDNLHPRTPQPLPKLPQTPWLIAFAAERGMGVAPGKAAYDLLYQALQEGDEDQRLAAMYYLSRKGNESTVLPLYHTYFPSTGDVREAAFETLWNLSAAGVELPPPIQYGLK
jgi:HEAT repeat protein